MKLVDYNELYQTADWKKEKHVPVISVEGSVKKGEEITLRLHVGEEIGHPNTTEHHIRWIKVLFHPRGEKFPYELGKAEFNAHGESVEGPDTSTVYCNPEATIRFKTEKPGTIISESYCNIHGLWRSEMELKF
jgi:superoxide reductase